MFLFLSFYIIQYVKILFEIKPLPNAVLAMTPEPGAKSDCDL